MNPEQNITPNPVNEQPYVAPVAPIAPKPFPVAKLLLIIFGPGVALVFTMILQIFVRFLGVNGGLIVKIINLVTALIGAVSVISIILMPVFIIVLIVRYNKQNTR